MSIYNGTVNLNRTVQIITSSLDRNLLIVGREKSFQKPKTGQHPLKLTVPSDQLVDAKNNNKALTGTNDELKDQLITSRLENTEINSQLTESNKQLIEQKKQNKRQAAELEKRQKIIDGGKQELAAAKQTIISLKEHQGINSALQTDNQKLTVENEKLRTEVDVLRSVVDKIAVNKK